MNNTGTRLEYPEYYAVAWLSKKPPQIMATILALYF